MTAWLRMHNAGLRFGARVALHGLTLDIAHGERVALGGANGSGKSSFLRLAHGLLAPSEGQVWRAPDATQAMLFQRPFMWHMNALGNVRLAAWLGQASWREARQQAQTALAQVSLAAQASQMARTLSGGQQQRLALARAWVQQPQILLLDEPTANLDPQAKREVEQLVGDWSQNTGAGLLFASHNLGQVKRLATRVLYLEAGAVLADLPVETFFNAPLAQTHPQAHAFLKGELG